MDVELGKHWPLDPKIAFLNHGSFGSCPLPVLAFQQALRDAANRDFGSVHKYAVFAKSPKALVKIVQSCAKTHRQQQIYLGRSVR